MKSLLSFTVYPYGVACAAALSAFYLVSLYCARMVRKGLSDSEVSFSSATRIFAIAVPSGLVISRAFWCVFNYYEYTLSKPLEIIFVSNGGLSMWGFILGFWLAAAIAANSLFVSKGAIMDAFAPGFMLFIAIMRIAEVFTGQGVGRIITYDWLITPVTAVYDAWGDARFAVYIMETAAAVIVFACAFASLRKALKTHSHSAGDIWLITLSGYAAFQITFESMREDDCMIMGFVKISFAISVLFLIAVSFYFMKRLKNIRRLGVRGLWLTLLTLSSAALIVYQEFQVDAAAHVENELLLMFIGACLLFLPSFYARRKLIKHSLRRRRRISSQR